MNPNEASFNLAMLLARRRTSGAVYMDGSSDPVPSEYDAADQFITDLLDQGWTPPSSNEGDVSGSS